MKTDGSQQPTRIFFARHHILRTHELDELRQAVCANYHPGHYETKSPTREFSFYYNHAFLPGISFSYHTCSNHLHIDSGPTEDSYILQFDVPDGNVEITHGKSTVHCCANGDGSLISPVRNCVWEFSAGSIHLIARIERPFLESYVEALTGAELSQPLEFEHQINMRDPQIVSLKGFFNYLITDIDNVGGLLTNPIIQAKEKNLFLYMLLHAQPHNYTNALTAHELSSGPDYVRKAEDYIREHAHEEMSVVDLAKKFHTSLRSLQIGFRHHRPYSISEFIKMTRLNLARERIVGESHRTIGEIVFACGFNHLSQFSADYKKFFGESPSETRRRSRPKIIAPRPPGKMRYFDKE